jgi:ribosome recycling factor
MDENSIRSRMQKTIDSLKKDLAKIRTGTATPAMLDHVMVDYYGTMSAVSHVASVSVPEPRTLCIQPFEKSMLDPIDKALQASDLGLPPENDGRVIRLKLPMLTTERRAELAKKVRAVGEDAKIGARNIRRDENDDLKKAAKEKSESEDNIKHFKDQIQSITDEFIKNIDELVVKKEEDIMKV